MKKREFSGMDEIGALALVSLGALSGCSTLVRDRHDPLADCLRDPTMEIANCTPREEIEPLHHRGRIQESLMIRRGFREFM
jgi:hypothetical protein